MFQLIKNLTIKTEKKGIQRKLIFPMEKFIKLKKIISNTKIKTEK